VIRERRSLDTSSALICKIKAQAYGEEEAGAPPDDGSYNLITD
jgi:hypothetical protein